MKILLTVRQLKVPLDYPQILTAPGNKPSASMTSGNQETLAQPHRPSRDSLVSPMHDAWLVQP